MDKITQLFIRACKVDHTHSRLRKLYRKFYMGGTMSVEETDLYLLGILVGITEKHCPMKLSTFIDAIDPRNCWLYNSHLDILINHIRFTSVDDLVGLTRPAKFRD